jgi:hypothetical protein
MDAFDADALIYAAVRAHPLGRRVATLFPTGPCSPDDPPAGVGSVLLLPEVLSKAIREQRTAERDRLEELLSRLELLPVDEPTASMAITVGPLPPTSGGCGAPGHGDPGRC